MIRLMKRNQVICHFLIFPFQVFYSQLVSLPRSNNLLYSSYKMYKPFQCKHDEWLNLGKFQIFKLYFTNFYEIFLRGVGNKTFVIFHHPQNDEIFPNEFLNLLNRSHVIRLYLAFLPEFFTVRWLGLCLG